MDLGIEISGSYLGVTKDWVGSELPNKDHCNTREGYGLIGRNKNWFILEIGFRFDQRTYLLSRVIKYFKELRFYLAVFKERSETI